MTTYKTPGVYIEEIVKFPPSVAQVETAIPGFIGYTEKATKKTEGDLNEIPTRISSLLEYETYFGFADLETSIGVKVEDTLDGSVENRKITVTPPSSPSPYLMYYSLQMYFANGGGPCYITSVGQYGSHLDTPETDVQFSNLNDGLDAVRKVDEVTLLVFPDATSIADDAEFYSLYNNALMQCNELQDRFTIIDTYSDKEYDTGGGAMNPIVEVREGIALEKDYLKYGAVYYPFLETILDYRYNLDQISLEHLSYEANAVTTVQVELDDLRVSIEPKVTAIVAVTDADLDLTNDTVSGSVQDVIHYINDASGFDNAGAGDFTTAKKTAFVPLLDTLVSDLQSLIDDKEGIKNAINSAIASVEEDALADDAMIATRDTFLGFFEAADSIESVHANLVTLAAKLGKAGSASKVLGTLKEDTLNVIDEVANVFAYTWVTPFPDNTLTITANLFGTIVSTLDTLISDVDTIETVDINNGPLNGRKLGKITGIDNATFNIIKSEIGKLPVVLPPSATIAGIYARVDADRGVWKAPANVGLNYVIEPSVQVSHEDQRDLNVDTVAGKSVNAIRAFVGKGNLVWGARTLAGNDNEWRYVSVRRFFNMVEESVKKATEQFVFEPNDKNTWVRVKAMIDNFLTSQWRAGALAGPTPDKAFYVSVGLGETMTAQDILEGNMIVEIGMAAVRPAEFIILRFSHKMQEV